MASKNKNLNKKANTTLIIAAILIAGVVAAVYLSLNQTNPFSSASRPPVSLYESSPIQNDDDLMKASRDLDNTNIDDIDNELIKSEADIAGL